MKVIHVKKKVLNKGILYTILWDILFILGMILSELVYGQLFSQVYILNIVGSAVIIGSHIWLLALFHGWRKGFTHAFLQGILIYYGIRIIIMLYIYVMTQLVN